MRLFGRKCGPYTVERYKKFISDPGSTLHKAIAKRRDVILFKGPSTYHGFDFPARPDRQILWDRAINAKFYGKGKPFEQEDFDKILGEASVVSDVPAIAFAEELVGMFPEVFRVRRDVEKWYDSFNTNVIASNYTWTVQILCYVFDPFLAAPPATTFLKLMYAMFNALDRAGLERNARQTYIQLYEMVKKLVPPERLLKYKLGSG
ncbi:hypothetical protein AJ79_08640 [Helicocarpus griseus UAMH5409]|uniref:Uncharacterized protein n=1 Tax=Helicocarpus griseus UAMH5409 TaxID=1447875 RepID=A0A2B7WRT9_9EURO|nr:hypothetical protein AJ79_08640 [Helicocarpus griseus UAMH5409]